MLAIGATQLQNDTTTRESFVILRLILFVALGVVMDVSVIDRLDHPAYPPSTAPTVGTQPLESNTNPKIESLTLSIFVPIGVVVLGMIVCLAYFLFHHKIGSRNQSYERNSVHFIRRQQTKQIHCVSLQS